jgi:hypothetical protein
MDIANYLIDPQRFDWSAILADWAWLLPEKEFTIWLMNRYGDLFIVTKSGAIYLLDVCGGSVERVAENREDFCRLVEKDDNSNRWFMIPLVDKLVTAGKLLKDGRCYSFVLPPVLGGEYTIENTSDLTIEEHFNVYASIHHQIKDLPDGTGVQLKVET